MAGTEDLKRAIDLAIAGNWGGAHAIAQSDENNPLYCWLHACLHRMEGDTVNARYWYRQAGRRFEDYADPQDELAALGSALTSL